MYNVFNLKGNVKKVDIMFIRALILSKLIKKVSTKDESLKSLDSAFNSAFGVFLDIGGAFGRFMLWSSLLLLTLTIFLGVNGIYSGLSLYFFTYNVPVFMLWIFAFVYVLKLFVLVLIGGKKKEGGKTKRTYITAILFGYMSFLGFVYYYDINTLSYVYLGMAIIQALFLSKK